MVYHVYKGHKHKFAQVKIEKERNTSCEQEMSLEHQCEIWMDNYTTLEVQTEHCHCKKNVILSQI